VEQWSKVWFCPKQLSVSIWSPETPSLSIHLASGGRAVGCLHEDFLKHRGEPALAREADTSPLSETQVVATFSLKVVPWTDSPH